MSRSRTDQSREEEQEEEEAFSQRGHRICTNARGRGLLLTGSGDDSMFSSLWLQSSLQKNRHPALLFLKLRRFLNKIQIQKYVTSDRKSLPSTIKNLRRNSIIYLRELKRSHRVLSCDGAANFVSMEFFITQQLFQRPWEINHMSSTPTNDASNNIVDIQSPVAVFYEGTTNSLINIYSKNRTRRDKLLASKWLALLPPSPRDDNSR